VSGPTLIVDWDGTITEHDSLLMVLEQFGDWEECQRLGEQLFAGEITLREEIERQFTTVTAPLGEVVLWVVENVRVRPGLPELAALHPVVVSSGFHELIDPVLAREDVSVDLHANNVEAGPDGWRPIWRELPVCAICGQPCKRGELPASSEVVYVGDGYSDRCAALAAERIFARRGLAAYLDEQGIGYEPFDDLHQIAAALS
jgi:2-hydroxy-3-keto-5-methylthiopentenyl-1-phosphate phosphatase